jgi:hypothetical protein
MKIQHRIAGGLLGLAIASMASSAFADCSALPSWPSLKSALVGSVGIKNGGLGFNEWATIVATDGTVCAVAFSGQQYTAQWLGSRVISAQKANTANDFSLGIGTPATSLFPHGLSLSTANLYSAVQPGGSLYGLQHSNPVDTGVAYDNADDEASAYLFGTPNDPMVGHRIGGVNVFGGGLALYYNGVKVGGLGASGDTSCADHNIAWRIRNTLGLDGLGQVSGVNATADPHRPDNIIFDIISNPNGGTGISPSGFGHPTCLNPVPVNTLPAVH